MPHYIISFILGGCIMLSGCSQPLSESETQKANISPQEENMVIPEDMLDSESFTSQDIQVISQEERDSLIHMREEEKLAQDVYLSLYDTWGKNIFQNITESETTHTDAVANLLKQFDIEAPVTEETQGVFQNPELQALYNTLIEQGKKSLLDALIVGATIEDLNIQDIEAYRAIVKHPDILRVYENLQRGSRNHLRSFVKNIKSE